MARGESSALLVYDELDEPPSQSGERLVEVGFSSFFGEEDEPDFGPWCVDHGQAIECMSTADVWHALATGRVTPDTKVWRDGRACWEPIAQIPELTVEPPEDSRERGRRSVPVPLCRERHAEIPPPARVGWQRALLSHLNRLRRALF